ncbi:MAG: outer membrane protein [Xanthobacteraceae bacterium]|nr:outer membrane beta-barrel protein [Xanthobacteraceae bacterium]
MPRRRKEIRCKAEDSAGVAERGKIMRKMVVASAALLFAGVVAGAAPANAADLVFKAQPYQPNWYFEARIGSPIAPANSSAFDFTIPQAGFASTYEPRTGFYGNLAIGRYFTPNWRYEFEFALGYAADGFHGGVPDTGSLTSIGLMANLLYDFKNHTAWTPFIGAGLGTQIVSMNRLGGAMAADDTDIALAASIIAGLDYRWNRNWTATARYTGLYTGGMSFDTNIAGFTVEREAGWLNIVTVGMRYQW